MILKKVLITGASGRIGYSFYSSINKKKYITLGLCNKNKINKNFKIINIIKKKKLNKIINDFKPDIIFHFAAYGNHYKSKNKTVVNYKTTRNLVEIIKRKDIILVFLSTDKIYENNPKKNNERQIPKPTSEYPLFKLKCEQLIIKELKKYLILRVPIIDKKTFNTNSYKHFSLMIIEEFVKKLRKDEKVTVFKNVFRSFVYLEELVNFFLKILEKKFEFGLYNIGSKTFSYHERLKLALDNNIKLKKFKKNIRGINGNVSPKKQSLNTKKFKKEFNLKFN